MTNQTSCKCAKPAKVLLSGQMTCFLCHLPLTAQAVAIDTPIAKQQNTPKSNSINPVCPVCKRPTIQIELNMFNGVCQFCADEHKF